MEQALPGADWRDAAAYAPLLEIDAALMAWEWLRRDHGYRMAAGGFMPQARSLRREDCAAGPWGLHAFEDAALPAPLARPVWRIEQHPRILVAAAERGDPPGDGFDLRRFTSLATIVVDLRDRERLLLCDGKSSLRIDIEEGTMLKGPVRFAYRLAGFETAAQPLATLERLLKLARSGVLPRPAVSIRNRRLILLLRAYDGLRAGASQRDIASVLLRREPLPERWRIEAPTLRSQAQRLVHRAKAMASGGFRELLE